MPVAHLVKVRCKVHQQTIGCSENLGGISKSDKGSFQTVTERNSAKNTQQTDTWPSRPASGGVKVGHIFMIKTKQMKEVDLNINLLNHSYNNISSVVQYTVLSYIEDGCKKI